MTWDQIVKSRLVVAYVLAALTGLYLYFNYPVTSEDPLLQIISLRSPRLYIAGVYTYTLMLFSTPFIFYSMIFFAAVHLRVSQILHGRGWPALAVSTSTRAR